MSNFDQKVVIQRIEKRLVELGMSKDEFYELSGVSSASFSQWNTGKHSPTPKKLSAVAKALRVSTDYLLTGEQKETPSTQEGGGLETEFVRLFQMLTSEQQERELAYLRELTGGKDR